MTQPYRPKLLFQQSTQDREAWQALAGNGTVRRAIAFAQADMAQAGFSDTEMKGVAYFIVGLLNLSENVEETATAIPIQRLKSYDPEEKSPPKPKQ